ncbi:chaperone, partial [Coemansia sp. RSA 1804]
TPASYQQLRMLGTAILHRAAVYAGTGVLRASAGARHALCAGHRLHDAFKDKSSSPGLQHRLLSSETAADTLAKNKAPVIRRFWKTTGVEERDGNYVILLDKRPIKTPDGKQVQISGSQGTLAWLVAGEWESQTEVVGSHSLPLTSLIFRSIDGLYDPHVRAEVVDKLLKYFQTDSVCLREEYPQTLVDLQQKHHAPIVEWASDAYGIDIQATDNIFALRQSSQAVARLREVVLEFSPLKLAALERAVMTAKSFLIGLALMEQRLSVEEAAIAAQVEASSQTQRWGELENAHDIDNAAIRQILGASACVALDA